MSRRLKKDKVKKVPLKKKREKPIEIALEFGSKVFPSVDFPKMVIITLPLRTVSEANCFEPWQKKHKRHKAQKKAVFFEMIPIKQFISLPCQVTYIRYAPRMLDTFENLPTSFKYINDQVCAEITGDHRPGRADGDKRITLKCDQVKSKEYGVKIIIEF